MTIPAIAPGESPESVLVEASGPSVVVDVALSALSCDPELIDITGIFILVHPL